MKDFKTILLFILLLCQNVMGTNHFTISTLKEQRRMSIITVNSIYENSTTITPFINTYPISGLCISGTIRKQSEDYLVRIILKDKDKHEHCILESYDMINDSITFSFKDYCEETALVDCIVPDSIVIIVHHATLKLDKIIMADTGRDNNNIHDKCLSEKYVIKKAQVEDISRKINIYNMKHRIPWGAGVTLLSLKSYEQRTRLLGLNNFQKSEGFEYYQSGIFVSGQPSYTPNIKSSSCISDFDWCNRHGRSWITGIRHQGNSSFCFAFSAIAAIESMLMLYYNSNDSVILSADMAARCTYDNPAYRYHHGGLAFNVLKYVKENGVCDNDASPFVDTDTIPCRSDVIIPNELVKIVNCNLYNCYSEDYIKEKLIINGPMTSGYKGHAMLLVGYGVIKVGDVIRINYGVGDTSYNYTVQLNDTNYIGKTYWKFKNSYGYNPSLTVNGYSYILFNNLNNMRTPCSVIQPYRTINTTANKIVCEDADGDGYYFWGMANRQSSWPSWIPDSIDGNDNDPQKGKIYLESPQIIGELESINPNGIPTLTINSNTTYTTRQYKRTHIVIAPNKTLTVKNILNMFGRPTITVQSGGQLIVDGGVITNADRDLAAGAKLVLENGGKIVMRTNTNFHAPLGALVDITHGEILRSNDF